MREAFRFGSLRPAKMEYIDTINVVLQEYYEQGYRLTLRQLYYQLVARGVIPNRTQEYQKLSSVLVEARMYGFTDWDMIEDRIRRPHLLYWVLGIEDALEDTANHYRLNRQRGQRQNVEIWTEKDAVSNILRRVSEYFHVRLMVNRGYSSCSAMKASYDRFSSESRPTVIIYVGDHDPSGLDMVRDIEDRLNEFGVEELSVEHVALTRDQIDMYNPPPNPAKITDPRADWYIGLHGDNSWELDALRPSDLEAIVREAVLANIHMPTFERMLAQEEEDKKKILDFISQLEE